MANNIKNSLDAASKRSGWDIVNDFELYPAAAIITDNSGKEKHPEPDDYEINVGQFIDLENDPLMPTELEFIFATGSKVEVGDAFDPQSFIITKPFYASIPNLKWVILNGEVEGSSIDELLENEEPLKDENGDPILDEDGKKVYPETCAACYGNTIQMLKPGKITIAVEDEATGKLFTSVNLEIVGEGELEEEVEEPNVEPETTTYTWVNNEEPAQTVTTTSKEDGEVTVDNNGNEVSGIISGNTLTIDDIVFTLVEE